MKRIMLMFLLGVLPAYASGSALLSFGPEQFVQADGIDIQVPGYSVPSFVDWNNDGLGDLIVGQGSGTQPAKIRVYLNVGTETDPQFSDFFYVQAAGSDLVCPGSGCLGCFPRVVYWDADDKKDLLIGQADGTVVLYLNTGTDENPTFRTGTYLQFGPPEAKTNIDVVYRATPTVVDWNNDGAKDLLIGSRFGKIYLYLNEGTDTEPDFRTETFVQADGSDFVVPSQRSSPVVADLDNDGKKDILTGNTDGQLLFYHNVATDQSPQFSTYQQVLADGLPIDLPGTPRSRPFLCFWTGSTDAYPDLLVGSGDGKVRLYLGLPRPADLNVDGRVDFLDMAVFASQWLRDNCGRCDGADLVDDDHVDLADLAVYAAHWARSR